MKQKKKQKKKNEFPSEYDFIGFDCARVLRVKVGLPAILRRFKAVSYLDLLRPLIKMFQF